MSNDAFIAWSDDEEWITGDPVSSRLVHRLITPGVLEIHQIRVRPGPARRSVAHANGITEHIVLHSGRMRVGPAESPVVLAAGDTASYPGIGRTSTRRWSRTPPD